MSRTFVTRISAAALAAGLSAAGFAMITAPSPSGGKEPAGPQAVSPIENFLVSSAVAAPLETNAARTVTVAAADGAIASHAAAQYIDELKGEAYD